MVIKGGEWKMDTDGKEVVVVTFWKYMQLILRFLPTLKNTVSMEAVG